MFEIFFFFFFQKFAGLWLVGKVDNHVAIYGSKVAEGFSAFQRRLVCTLKWAYNILYQTHVTLIGSCFVNKYGHKRVQTCSYFIILRNFDLDQSIYYL